MKLSSATNQDGRSASIAAPGGQAQRGAVRLALCRAGARAEDVHAVECHGAGTVLGGPAEVAATEGALRPRITFSSIPITLGAVKTNIGHLGPACGAAGLIKCVLVLRSRRMPPNLHLRELNPHIDHTGISVRIATEAVELCHRATAFGVSAFGFGGTNAHLLVLTPHMSCARDES